MRRAVLTTKSKFNKELLYLNILIVLLVFVAVFVGYKTLKSEQEKIRVEVENTTNELNTRIKTRLGSILSLNAAAGEIYKNRATPHEIVAKIKEFNAQGDFALNIPILANLTGYGGLDHSKKVVHEMATSLALTKYFAIIKQLNDSLVRVYYASKSRFSTSYPYVWSDQFMWSEERMTRPLWLYATPALNKEKKLFFTPLHKCLRKEKTLVTIGYPLYNGEEFLGTFNLDLGVEAEHQFLESKNQHDGTYVIVNLEGQVVAASGLEGYTDKVIFDAKQLMSKEILAAGITEGEALSLDSDYLYVKQLENAPWRLYYIKDKFSIYLYPLYYIGMLFAVILLLFKVKSLIKHLSASRDELERQALTDPMTKLYNRRYLAEITHHMLGLMRRNQSKLAVIMLDIDKFKNVNDTYGHQVGDDVIIKLSETLQAFTRKSDVVCRLGGEEFLVLLPETGMDGAMLKAETLREEVEKLCLKLSGDIELRFTISSGVSEVLMDEENFELAMNRADNALYEAKESGRNKVCQAEVPNPSEDETE